MSADCIQRAVVHPPPPLLHFKPFALNYTFATLQSYLLYALPEGTNRTVNMSECLPLPSTARARGTDLLWNEPNEDLTDAHAVLKACQAVNKCELV